MIEIGRNGIDLEKYRRIVFFKEKVRLSHEVRERIKKGREELFRILKKGKPIYSVNTGVGRLADKIIPIEKIKELQRNIIRSHAVGWGEPAPPEVVRGAILLRINCISQGYSGVSLELVEKLVELLNKDIIPFIPVKGSVGASGDLAPLSFIGLVVMGEGYIIENGNLLPAYLGLKRKNIKPYELKEKEGIGLINGTQFSLSLLLHAFYKFETLFKLSLFSSALSFIALDGNIDSFNPFLGKIRNSSEQISVSKILKKLLKGYKRKKRRKNVQDPYTLRCIPQILGAVLELKNFVKDIALSEINAVTDNPVLKDGKAISGGNFHAQRLSFAGDIMAIAISTLSNFSERRIFQLMGVEPEVVPRFLAKKEGLSSGYMLVQVLSAALASQNKTLAFPNSVDSIPTSLNQEDFVSMSAGSILRIFEMLDNLEGILIGEIVSSLRAIHLTGAKLPPFISTLLEPLKEGFRIIEEDHFVYEDIKRIKEKISPLLLKIDEHF